VAKDSRRFWSRYARLYDFEINRFSAQAYQQMYGYIAKALQPEMDVLEIATGTGLIALQIAGGVKSVVATDFSEGMIAAARRKPAPANVSFIESNGFAVGKHQVLSAAFPLVYLEATLG
jgi:ubiquinone/menaquinone biosynthesis C-methylase UbiE